MSDKQPLIQRPTPPAETNPFDTLFEHAPDVLDLKMQQWVESSQPWRKLAGVHPELRLRVWRIVMAMAVLGYRMMVTDGARTDLEQQKLYAQGRTLSGKIVTHCDGVKRRSNHQERLPPSTYAGYASAVDMTFVGPDLKPTWSDDWPWELYGRMAKGQALVWGGDWPTQRRDRPHVELFE